MLFSNDFFLMLNALILGMLGRMSGVMIDLEVKKRSFSTLSLLVGSFEGAFVGTLTFFFASFIFTEIYVIKNRGNIVLFLSGLMGWNGIKSLNWFKSIIYNIANATMKSNEPKP